MAVNLLVAGPVKETATVGTGTDRVQAFWNANEMRQTAMIATALTIFSSGGFRLEGISTSSIKFRTWWNSRMYGSVNTIRDAPSSQGQKSNSELTEPISLGLGANPLAVHKRTIA
jgi:hypothetical protein